MIQRYLNGAIVYDFIVGIVLGTVFYLLIQKFNLNIEFPSDQSGLVSSLLVVSSMLLGFLMTIITVIITFKKGIEIKVDPDCENYKGTNSPESTVFDRKTKQHLFYGTPMVEFVTSSFIKSAIEISIVVVFLLIREFFNPNIPVVISASLTLVIIIVVTLTIFRSLHVFRLYMRVHSKDEE